MNDSGASADVSAVLDSPPCYFFYFGLIVTGEGERDHLPKLFSTLTETGICRFEVIRRVGQRSPIIAEKRKVRMVRKWPAYPTRDEEEIGIPARRYIKDDNCRFVLLVDDLEHERREKPQPVFDRYRLALD